MQCNVSLESVSLKPLENTFDLYEIVDVSFAQMTIINMDLCNAWSLCRLMTDAQVMMRTFAWGMHVMV